MVEDAEVRDGGLLLRPSEVAREPNGLGERLQSMRILGFIGCAGVVLALTACGAPESATEKATPSSQGAAAVWLLAEDAHLSDSSVRVPVEVQRLGCASGVTGSVRVPTVEYTDADIVVTFFVEPDPDGGDCPSNERVGYEVRLEQPVNGRRLVDGQCRPGREAATTSLCRPNGIRWAPQ